MQSIYNNMKFIVSFLVTILIFDTFIGNKFTYWLLVLLLISVVLMNSEKFTMLLNDIAKTK